MLDYVIFFLLKYTYVITAALFLVKTYLFLRHKNKRWRLLEFLYFNELNIKYTSTESRAKLKRVQNTLSIIILGLIMLQLISLVLFRN